MHTHAFALPGGNATLGRDTCTRGKYNLKGKKCNPRGEYIPGEEHMHKGDAISGA